jgi:hypothetical protein
MVRRFRKAWSSLSFDERAHALHLPAHLAAARQAERLRTILTEFEFLQTKVEQAEPEELIRDYELADSEGLEVVQAALRLAAHALHLDPFLLPAQLLGLLRSADGSEVRSLLDQAGEAAFPWLCPLTSSLGAPGQPLLRTLRGHFY